MQALQDYQQRFNDLVHNDRERKQPITSLPNYDPACMKEGYLQKKGQRLKGWKRRWFVCDGRTLSYYISRKDRKPNVVIPLESCTVQDGGISETWNSPRIYLTDGTSGVMYCLSAEDTEVVTAWLSVLRTSVARLRGDDEEATTESKPIREDEHDHKSSVMIQRSTSDVTDREPSKPRSRGEHPVSSDSSIGPEVKRATRLTSGPAYLGSRGGNSKTQHHATSISFENDLVSGLDTLEALLNSRGAARHSVTFRPLSAAEGVIKSIGTDAEGLRTYARASTVIPVPSEVAAYYITDNSRRVEWDIHFPISTHIASFDESTELIHLEGRFQQINTTRQFLAPHLAVAFGAIAGALLASSWEATLVSVIIGGFVAGFLNGIDYSSLCKPRELLLLRHVRESSVLDKRTPSSSNLLEADGDDTQPVVLILEKSVVSELKPVRSEVVRAYVGLSGWMLEPVDENRTRATYLTDIDARGFISPETKVDFLIERLNCVGVLLEHISQSQLCGLDSGIEDRASVDGDMVRGDDDMLVYHENLETDELASSEFHPSVYMKGMLQIPSGGLKLIDKEVAKKQGGVLKDVIKSAGAKMLEGKGTVSLSLPVRIFEPRTNLERVVDLFLYGPTYLNLAAEQTDPVERFKLVMSFAVAGMHHSVGQLKPFNPILGETYQSTLNDGTEVACEHTSHHPPISNFQLVGRKYSISGYILWHGSFSMKSNAVIQNNRGPIRVSFDDGTVISYNLPVMQSGGFLWGDRTVELVGSVHFEDKKNRIACELKFNPDEKKGMGGMFSASKTPSDQVRGVIINTSTSAELCDVSGSWLEELRFGDKAYWVFGRERSGFSMPYPEDKLLVSDSRNREDLRFLARNDLDTAQDWKVRLEVLQRADRKIRNEGRRPNHWSLKDDKGSH